MSSMTLTRTAERRPTWDAAPPQFDTLNAAVDHLAVLPTVDAVADELVALGLAAVPGVSYSCILAEYFRAVTAYKLVRVLPLYGQVAGSDSGVVWAWNGNQRVGPPVDEAVLTRELDLLAWGFDMLEFPKLIKRPGG